MDYSRVWRFQSLTENAQNSFWIPPPLAYELFLMSYKITGSYLKGWVFLQSGKTKTKKKNSFFRFISTSLLPVTNLFFSMDKNRRTGCFLRWTFWRGRAVLRQVYVFNLDEKKFFFFLRYIFFSLLFSFQNDCMLYLYFIYSITNTFWIWKQTENKP